MTNNTLEVENKELKIKGFKKVRIIHKYCSY